MKCRRCFCRYFVVVSFLCSLTLLIIALIRASGEKDEILTEAVRHYISSVEDAVDRRVSSFSQVTVIGRHGISAVKSGSSRSCRMSNCFNITMCRNNGFRVYVYPPSERTVSSKYGEILEALRSSIYYTNNPEQACLFVLAIDTLDRDRLSSEYVHDIQSQINSLKWWRGGVNHVVFNLYSGTWPDYSENGLGFDVGQAMLAKASISRLHYRSGFDISFPLFHKELSYRGGEPSAESSKSVPVVRKYLLSFKGKRYLTGIGSETRSSLYHIHNGRDIILLTTCKHGKGWNNIKDDRCQVDNAEYDKWDYKTLMLNSTFCLVPRGRRVGSYRFLESLQTACIPVILSNDWVLPFSEVIDWNKAAVVADEQLLLQVPALVRSIAPDSVLTLRQQTQFLWETYFSSIEKIVSTTLEILKDRIDRQTVRSSYVWNTAPGALVIQSEYSRSLDSFPFYRRYSATSYYSEPSALFTAVLYMASSTTSTATISTSMFRLIKNLNRSSSLHKIIILCHQFPCISSDVRWPVRVPVVTKTIASANERFMLHSEVETDAIFTLNDDVQLLSGEFDFAFSVWCNFPDRLIGFHSRSHFWDETSQLWRYTSKATNDYSLVLASAAIYHKYYNYLYMTWVPRSLTRLVDRLSNCEDILFNFLFAYVVHHPPIKLTQRHSLNINTVEHNSEEHKVELGRRLLEKHLCLNKFTEEFGEMILLRSSSRLDPILYKDLVSKLRKKYRQLDSVA